MKCGSVASRKRSGLNVSGSGKSSGSCIIVLMAQNDELKGRVKVTGSLLEVPEDDGALRDVVLFVVVVATHAMRDRRWNHGTPSTNEHRPSGALRKGQLKLCSVPLYFFDECTDIWKRLHIFECG